MADLERFIQVLKDDGWKDAGGFLFKKGTRKIIFDTSSCMEVGTINTPRVFDVLVPNHDRYDRWTLNLIEHLCKTDDLINEKRE